MICFNYCCKKVVERRRKDDEHQFNKYLAENFDFKLFVSFIEDGLRQFVFEPQHELHNKGRIHGFVDKFNDVTYFLSFCGRDKVVRTLLTNLMQVEAAIARKSGFTV